MQDLHFLVEVHQGLDCSSLAIWAVVSISVIFFSRLFSSFLIFAHLSSKMFKYVQNLLPSPFVQASSTIDRLSPVSGRRLPATPGARRSGLGARVAASGEIDRPWLIRSAWWYLGDEKCQNFHPCGSTLYLKNFSGELQRVMKKSSF